MWQIVFLSRIMAKLWYMHSPAVSGCLWSTSVYSSLQHQQPNNNDVWFINVSRRFEVYDIARIMYNIIHCLCVLSHFHGVLTISVEGNKVINLPCISWLVCFPVSYSLSGGRENIAFWIPRLLFSAASWRHGTCLHVTWLLCCRAPLAALRYPEVLHCVELLCIPFASHPIPLHRYFFSLYLF